MSLTLNAQIDKIPFGMQVCKIQNCKYYFTETFAQNKVSVSNGIKITNTKKKIPTIFCHHWYQKWLHLILFTFKNKRNITQKYSLKKRENSANAKLWFFGYDVFINARPICQWKQMNDVKQYQKIQQRITRKTRWRYWRNYKNLDILRPWATIHLSTPLCRIMMLAYSYHTYGQSDVYKIDPRYGMKTMQD
jgi:hypothetical protein